MNAPADTAALATLPIHWPRHGAVGALITTRAGGVSSGPFATLNLRRNSGDDDAAVAVNRARLRACLPADPVWLNQVHGVDVVDVDRNPERIGDAALTRTPGVVIAIQTADCLPVLFAADSGAVVAVAHAGWRGLAAGVLENSVAAMDVTPASISVFLGPAIGQAAFEVGGEVRAAFVDRDAAAASAFVPGQPGKWHADLYALARQRLAAVGVNRVLGGGYCTYTETERFFSYRRAKVSGRLASLIWIAPERAV